MKETGGKLVTIEQISAGGVAYRAIDDRIEIAIILTIPERRWQLPKGIIDAGETPEQAALREVREEAGINTELVEALDRTEYWFTAERDGTRSRFHKYVHWFLLKYTGGDVADHDHEVEEARWVEVGEALKLLAFKNERDIVEKAVHLIRTAN